MKRDTILLIIITIYVLVMVAMFFGVDKYVEAKDNRLRGEIHQKLSAVFERDRYVDISYSGYDVEYEKVAIPSKPGKSSDFDFYKQANDTLKKRMEYYDKISQKEWKRDYGDLYKMYRIKHTRDEENILYDYTDGWSLVTLRCDYEGVYQTWIFPYAVGYLKQSYSYWYEYAPSIKSAVNEAFDFFTKNDLSYFIDDFQKGCHNEIWDKIYDCGNEYYWLEEDENPRISTLGSPLFVDGLSLSGLHQAGYMHNGYYRVFIGETQPSTWTIRMRPWNPDEQDRKDLWMYWSIGLTILMLSIVIPLLIIMRRHKVRSEETLYQKLKRLCNPSRFMKDYNKEKIDKANAIYQQLMEIDPNDEETLMKLQEQAVIELGITLIDTEKLNELKKRCNPQQYMKPYDAEKVKLANDLYARLTKEGLTYEEFIDIEKRSKALYYTAQINEIKKKIEFLRYAIPTDTEKIKLADELYSRLTKEGLTYGEFRDIENQLKSLNI